MTPAEELPGCVFGVNIPRAVPLLHSIALQENVVNKGINLAKTPAWLLSNHPQSRHPLNCAPKDAPGAKAEEIPHNTFPTSAVVSSPAPFHTPFQPLSFRPQSEPGTKSFSLFPSAPPWPQPESPRCHRGVTGCSRSFRNSRDGIWIHPQGPRGLSASPKARWINTGIGAGPS